MCNKYKVRDQLAEHLSVPTLVKSPIICYAVFIFVPKVFDINKIFFFLLSFDNVG